MPVDNKPLTIRINNVEYVQSLAHSLSEMYEEMLNINVNNTPIKYATKNRWELKIKEVSDFLHKFTPKEAQ